MRLPFGPSPPFRALGVLGSVGASLILAFSGASLAVASPDVDPLSNDHGIVVDGPEPPKIWAKSWIVADAETGEVLAAKNAHQRLRPASTLKTLTAVTLLPKLDLNDGYRVQWEDAHATGSAVGIVPGSRYTIDELFYGLMLPSGNDAARALASAAGGLHRTVRAMNTEADALGAQDTHAINPTGLDAPGQFTSAFDLAIFTRAGLTNRDFRRYVSTVSTSFPAQEPKRDKRRDTYMIYNQNPLLLEGYRGILGVKTGYTSQAGRTFVAAVRRGDRTLIVALMGIVEPSETAAKRLFTWGFSQGDNVTAVGTLNEPNSVTHPDHETTVTTPPPQAAGVSTSTPDTGDSPAQGFAVWVLAGIALVGGGWWLQRRRT
ncbi:MAG: serine hydrolase [Actinomycetia bacterium]|nr:serine hydrolase [Actinomycetes bacterium]